MRVLGKFAVVVSVLVGVLVFSQPAAATILCVPDTSISTCPTGGITPLGSTPAAKIQSAMGGDADDGIPDTVYIDSGTYITDQAHGPFEVTGTDDLTVIGNGRDKTFLTSSQAANVYVVNLVTGNFRHVTLKDLSIAVPESFPNAGGYGAALQMSGDELDSVDIINRNAPVSSVESGSGGITAIQNGAVLNDVRFFGENGARFSYAINTGGSGSCGSGQILISQLEIRNSNSGLSTDCPGSPVTIDRAVLDGVDYALQAASGADLSASNVLITSGQYSPVLAYNSKAKGPTLVNLDQVTLVATGNPALPAIRATVANDPAATDSIAINIRNSIIAGFQQTWGIEAPESNPIGDVTLNLDYSSFDQVGQSIGDVAVNQGIGNISGDPSFVGLNDFHLTPYSAEVDAGDPNAADPILDLEGNSRPIDGNFDGTPVRDMGAYELNPPPPSCPADPDVCLPRLSKVKFNYKAGKGGALRFRVSKKGRVMAVFTPVPKKAKGKKRKGLRLFRPVKQGGNLFKLGKKALKPGRYRLVVRAFDDVGNKSQVVTRAVKVGKAGRK